MTAPLRPRRARVTVVLTEQELAYVISSLDSYKNCPWYRLDVIEKLRRARKPKPTCKPNLQVQPVVDDETERLYLTLVRFRRKYGDYPAVGSDDTHVLVKAICRARAKLRRKP